MKTAAIAFAASAVTGAVLTPVVRDLALRWKLVDYAVSSRKIHKSPVPRLGGIAIVLAFYAPLLGLLLVDSDVGRRFYASPSKAVGLFAGGLVLAAIGIADDLRGLRARHKLLGQLAVAALVYVFGYRIEQVAIPLFGTVPLGLFALPFTLLWITGVINALNLIDGLDGLAGGVAFIAVATTFAIAALNGEPLMMLFTAALGGAVLAFLFYNFNPASIFMGDTGSMFLGFVLATTSIETNQKSSTAVAMMVPIVALGIPIGETLLSMARRALRGVPMFQADRGHIHHRLLDRGLTQRQAVLVLYAFSAFLSLGAIALTFVSSWAALAVLGVLTAVVYLFLRSLGYFDFGQAPQVFEARKRNLELRHVVRDAAEMLRKANDVWEVFVVLRFVAAPLGASAIALHLPDMAGVNPLEHSHGFANAPRKMLRARYSLAVERPEARAIELGWTDGRKTVSRDTEIAIELLCQQVAAALNRIERGVAEEREISNIIRLWKKTG